MAIERTPHVNQRLFIEKRFPHELPRCSHCQWRRDNFKTREGKDQFAPPLQIRLFPSGDGLAKVLR